MKERIGSCKWRVLAGALAVGVFALSVSVSAADRDATRDKGQTTARANRLVSGPSIPAGTVTGGGIEMEFRWMNPATEVDATTVTYPAGTSGVGTPDLTLPGAPPGGQTLFLGLFIGNWGGVASDGELASGFAALDTGSFGPDLSAYRASCTTDAECDASSGADEEQSCGEFFAGECATAYYWQGHPLVDDEPWSVGTCDISTPDTSITCGTQAITETHPDDGNPGPFIYLGTFVLRAEDTIGGVEAVAPVPGSAGASDSGGNTFAATDITFTAASLTVPTASCCFNIGVSDPPDCVEDVSELACAALGTGLTDFRDGVALCPANGGPGCAECFTDNVAGPEPDSDCADPAPGTSDNRCTLNLCNDSLLCENPPIEDWAPATQCCNPTNGNLASRSDGDDCTEDNCTLDGTETGLGVPDHPVASAGTDCDDDNACTYDDVCNGTDPAATGGCAGTDINTESCTDNSECDALIPGVECVDGFCFCTLFPSLTFDITPGDQPKDPNCFKDGEKVDATVRMGAAVVPINGYQITVEYDPSCLDLQTVTPLAPWTTIVEQDVDEANGEIFVAAIVELGAGDGPQGNADVMDLSFLKIGECAECQLCFGGVNPRETILTDNTGQPLGVTPECSKTVRTAGDLTLDVPDQMTKVNVGCDSVRATVTWDAPTASDTCGMNGFVCAGQNEGGKDISDNVMTGGEFPRGGNTFCCWAQNDCGITKGFQAGMAPDSPGIEEGCWTVQVNDQTSLDIEIELSPTMESKPDEGLNRCIKFQGYGNCVQAPVVFEREMSFGGIWNLTGHSVDEIKAPSGQFECLTAMDQHHTLRACALRSSGDLACEGGTLFATFKGDPFFGGNWLVGGNLDGWKKDPATHECDPLVGCDVINILDFGQFIAQYLTEYDSDGDGVADGDVPCDWDGAHADINGDGIVDGLDFSFISLNFLEHSKDCCCPGSAGSIDATTEVTVRELRQAGLHHLVGADLNGDGLLNMDDMAAFLAGEVPSRKPVRSGLRSSGRK